MILDALPVGCYSVDSNRSFLGCEETCRGWKVGEDYQTDNTPRNRDRTENQEDVHPLWQASSNVSHSVPDQAAKHGRYAVCAVVYFETEGLLRRGIPHGHHQDEARVDNRLHSSQHKSVHCNACKTLACWRSDEDDPPDNGGPGEKFADGEALEQVSGWELSEEVTKIKDGTYMG